MWKNVHQYIIGTLHSISHTQFFLERKNPQAFRILSKIFYFASSNYIVELHH